MSDLLPSMEELLNRAECRGYDKAIEDMYNELQDLIYHDFSITLKRLTEVKDKLKGEH